MAINTMGARCTTLAKKQEDKSKALEELVAWKNSSGPTGWGNTSDMSGPVWNALRAASSQTVNYSGICPGRLFNASAKAWPRSSGEMRE
eukprot:1947729-Pyramimonas_sp.AAC.1